MSIKIKGSISIGYSQAERTFEFDISEFGLTEEEWKELTQKEKDEILDETLETEISNVLDAAIWEEGEED